MYGHATTSYFNWVENGGTNQNGDKSKRRQPVRRQPVITAKNQVETATFASGNGDNFGVRPWPWAWAWPLALPLVRSAI